MNKRGILVVLAFATLGVLLGTGFFRDFLSIGKVIIEGGGRITTDDVQRLINFGPGDSIWAADFHGATQRLRQHPWVKSVQIVWRFPDVHIRLQEREPFAVVNIPDQGLTWCDEEGHVLDAVPVPQAQRGEEATTMVIDGMGAMTMTDSGRQVGDEAQWRLVRLILQSELSDLFPLERIRFYGQGVDLHTSSRQRIRLPLEDAVAPLRQLRTVWLELREANIPFESLDLRFAGELTYGGTAH